MTELDALKQTTELYSDLIKIGIPSIVALAGLASSFILAWKGYKKDIFLQSLQISHEHEKERNRRKGELIHQISAGVTELHSKVIDYTSHLIAKLDVENDGHPYPEKNRKILSEKYQSLVDHLTLGFTLKTHAYLLGNNAVIDKYEKYFSSLTRITHNASPSTRVHPEEINKRMLAAGHEQQKLYALLSEVYLLVD